MVSERVQRTNLLFSFVYFSINIILLSLISDYDDLDDSNDSQLLIDDNSQDNSQENTKFVAKNHKCHICGKFLVQS